LCAAGGGAWRDHGNEPSSSLPEQGPRCSDESWSWTGWRGAEPRSRLSQTRRGRPRPCRARTTSRTGAGSVQGGVVLRVSTCVLRRSRRTSSRTAWQTARPAVRRCCSWTCGTRRAGHHGDPRRQCSATWRDPGRQRPRGHPRDRPGRALLPQRGALRTGCPQAPVCRIWGCRPPGGRRPGLDRPGRPEFTRH